MRLLPRRLQTVSPGIPQLQAAFKTWEAPADLNTPLPRAVRFSRNVRWVLLFFAILTTAVVVGVIGFGIPAARHESMRVRLVRSEGVSVNAATTDQSIDNGGKGGPSYNVAYQYQVDGKVFHARAQVPSQEYFTLLHGAPARAHYAKSHPELSMLDGEDVLAPWQIVVFGVWILVVISVLLVFPIRMFRFRRLLAWGKPTAAMVLSVGRLRERQMKSVTFEFLSASGTIVRGTDRMWASDEPAAGMITTVVYDPDRPSRNMTYPSHAVELS